MRVNTPHNRAVQVQAATLEDPDALVQLKALQVSTVQTHLGCGIKTWVPEFLQYLRTKVPNDILAPHRSGCCSVVPCAFSVVLRAVLAILSPSLHI